jgi:predicted SnoaL-like aldol condensation-catalyzing enzyme
MKRTYAAVAILALGLAATQGAQAQARVRSPQERRNLERVTYFIEDVLLKLKTDQFKDYVAPRFIEHHPGVDGTLEGLVGYFNELKQKNPNGLPPEKILVSMVDGDLVALLVVRDTVIDKNDASKSYRKLGIEIVRVKDGKQVEHWDEESTLADSPQVAALLPGLFR